MLLAHLNDIDSETLCFAKSFVVHFCSFLSVTVVQERKIFWAKQTMVTLNEGEGHYEPELPTGGRADGVRLQIDSGLMVSSKGNVSIL